MRFKQRGRRIENGKIDKLSQQRCFTKPTNINDPDQKCKVQKPLTPIILPANSPQLNGQVSKKETFWNNIAGAELLIKVTDSNIDQVLQKHRAILIMFYGTWCSVCKDVNVEIGKAATMITPAEGSFGICDAMDNVKAVDKFLITKTPSFKYFRNGVYVADYIGRPLANDIIFFMKSPPPPVTKPSSKSNVKLQK
ncbi:protein disulfide-isomerase A5 isoform X2 [Halyomorpha halys]|uniref:protein disulfide-isomerase A5 isoform X2 n=1 Tax=Halyomorpha halys TaxID=286706 RepID=UPI0006D50CB0|nr:protein disulfide-isomerase A5-like isoform X2 [Halyomorpha halys]